MVMLGGWNLREISQTLSGFVAYFFIGLPIELKIW